MQGDIVSGVLLPLILAFIMFSLGLGLTPGDFRRILAQPRALVAARHRFTAWALRFEPRATKVATLLFVLIVVAAVVKNWALLRDNFNTLAPFAAALNLGMLALGFAVAWAARLSYRQSVTLGIETAVQNAALALVIASTVLGNDAMAIPGAVYGVLMYGGGLLFALTMRRFARDPAMQAAHAG